MSVREIILDTETTGLDPFSGHRIVEIGCVEMIDRNVTGNNFHCYVNPRRDMPQEAFNVHGISSDFLLDKPFFEDVADGFLEFIADSKLIIHNAPFDVKFLNYELSLTKRPALKPELIVDTLKIARQRYPGSPASLDALCKRFGVDLSSRNKHGALIDSELLAYVYIALVGGDFAQKKIQLEEEIILNNLASLANADFPVRKIELLEEELVMHKEMLKNIKSPLWEE